MGRTALVTGGLGTLGQSVIRRFLRADYQVIGTDQRVPEGGITSRVEGFPETPNLHWGHARLEEASSIEKFCKTLQGQKINPGIWVHCAGGFRFEFSDQVKSEDIDFLIDVNLRSAFFLLKELLPSMKKQNFGRIILISSKATLNPPAGMASYCASKIGLNALVESVAEEVKKWNININAILPSVIDTPPNRAAMPQADTSTWVKPEQLAEIIFQLTQSWGEPIHGALLPVAGRV